MPAVPFLWSRIRPRCLRAWPTNSSGCRTARSWTARPRWQGGSDDPGPYRVSHLSRRVPHFSRRVPHFSRVFCARSGRLRKGATMTLWSVTLATLKKDLRLEWRSKDALNAMLFFSLLVVVIFSFSFDPLAEESRHIVGGLIWVAFLFAAVVALNQTWAREIRNQVLDAYRVSPAPANALFLAKALGNFIFVGVLEALMTPLFVVFYNLRVLGPAWQLIPIAGLGTWALVVNGTFFAAMSLRTRSRELMLPLLLFPISIPAVQSMVEATRIILAGDSSARFWIVLLLTYDVVFTTACLGLFATVLKAE